MDERIEKVETTLSCFFEYQGRNITLIIIF